MVALLAPTLAAIQESNMSAVVIEHVNVAELPDTWRARLPVPRAARVTVRLEEENTTQTEAYEGNPGVDILFGMWRDREDMADVEGYIRKLRVPRYNLDGSRNQV